MITGSTRVYALLGHPVRHSRSPELHNAWFAAHGIDAIYVALEARDGDRVLGALETLGISGANLTTPLKERVAASLPRLDPGARAIGAVNLLVRDTEGWRGENTDAEGFCRSVEARGISLSGRIAAVLGSGGAARAVASGLGGRGASEVRILGRSPDRAEAVAEALRGAFPGTRFSAGPIATSAIAGAELVAVTTSGRADRVGALDPSVLSPGAAWVDLNYWDPDPPGLRSAAESGCTTIEGGGMLTWQAALSFERWFGILPNVGSTGISGG